MTLIETRTLALHVRAVNAKFEFEVPGRCTPRVRHLADAQLRHDDIRQPVRNLPAALEFEERREFSMTIADRFDDALIDAPCPQCANDTVYLDRQSFHPAIGRAVFLCRCGKCGWRFRLDQLPQPAGDAPPLAESQPRTDRLPELRPRPVSTRRRRSAFGFNAD